jgi:hypothetical protein
LVAKRNVQVDVITTIVKIQIALLAGVKSSKF